MKVKTQYCPGCKTSKTIHFWYPGRWGTTGACCIACNTKRNAKRWIGNPTCGGWKDKKGVPFETKNCH